MPKTLEYFSTLTEKSVLLETEPVEERRNNSRKNNKFLCKENLQETKENT